MIKIENLFGDGGSQKSHESGTLQKPYLCKLTRGQRQDSVILHVRIGLDLHQLHTRKIGKKAVILSCRDRSCKAFHKAVVDKKLQATIPYGRKDGGGKLRAKFVLNLADPEILLLENWEIIPHDSKPGSDSGVYLLNMFHSR